MIDGILRNPPKRKRREYGSPSDINMQRVADQLDDEFTEHNASSRETILPLLQNKLSFQRPITHRSKTWLGVLWNALTRKTPGYITVQGIVMLSILRLLDETADIEITPEASYLLPFTEAKRIVRRLNQQETTTVTGR